MKWNGKSRGGRFGYLFFVYIIKCLGIRFAYCFLALVAFHFIMFAPKASFAIWQYYRNHLHYGILLSCWKLYLHYYRFGQTLIDKVAIRSGMSHKYHFIFDNYERFIDLINSNNGVVIIGAHVGCWEAGSAFFGKYGKKINIVLFDAEHLGIKDALAQTTEEQNYKIIPVNYDILDAIIKIKVALNNAEYVCFNGDRYVDETSALSFEFLGGDAKFPIGPFKIASKCNVPVVFFYAMREKGCTYRFIFEQIGVEEKLSTEFLLTQYVKSLESIVKRYPQQWFNFYRFWN